MKVELRSWEGLDSGAPPGLPPDHPQGRRQTNHKEARMIEMVDLINLGLKILPWFATFISYFVGTRQEKKKNRRELILDYYPDLIRDFQISVDEIESVLQGRYVGSYKAKFEVLLDMDKDGTLLIIESIDKELYEYMRRMVDDLLPTLENIEEERFNKFREMEKIWLTALFEILKSFNDLTQFNNRFDIGTMTEKNFVHQVSSFVIWELWKKDGKQAKAGFTKIVSDINTSKAAIISENLAKTTYEKFSEIANEEFEPIQIKISEMGIRLKEVISEKILPRMNDRMRNLAK